MKIIKTKNYIKLADLKTFPSIYHGDGDFRSEKDDKYEIIERFKNKKDNRKKKKLPQLGADVEDVNLRDITD